MSKATAEIGISKVIKAILGFSAIKHVIFFLPKVGVILFLVYAFCLAWLEIGPHKPNANPQRQRAAERAAHNALAEIRAHRGTLTNVKMFHFANDPTDCLSNQFRALLDETGILNLSDTSCLEKTRDFFHVREEGCQSAAEAVSRSKHSNVDGALWGVIDRFESYGSGVLLSGMYQLIAIPSGAVVYEGHIYENTITADVAENARKKGDLPSGLEALSETVEFSAKAVPWHIRFLSFVLIVVLLPVITIKFIRNMVARHSNRVNAIVLASYTIVGVIAAFLLVGGHFGTIFHVLVFLISGSIAFVYNYYMMSFALRLEGD